MWTCPVVLLSAHLSDPLLANAFHRGCDVILGGVTGWAFHWAAERLDGGRRLHGRAMESAAGE